MRTRLLLSTCVILLSSCSYLTAFWVEGELALTKCPSSDFELPERVLAGTGLVVANEDISTYCHGFTPYDLYPVPKGTRFLDVESPSQDGQLFARIDHGSTCKLRVLIFVRCEKGQPEKYCKRDNWPKLSEATVKQAILPYTEALLHRSGTQVEDLSRFEIVGFHGDLPKWCRQAAQARRTAWR